MVPWAAVLIRAATTAAPCCSWRPASSGMARRPPSPRRPARPTVSRWRRPAPPWVRGRAWSGPAGCCPAAARGGPGGGRRGAGAAQALAGARHAVADRGTVHVYGELAGGPDAIAELAGQGALFVWVVAEGPGGGAGFFS